MTTQRKPILGTFLTTLRKIDAQPEQQALSERNKWRAEAAAERLGERFVCATPVQRTPHKGVLS